MRPLSAVEALRPRMQLVAQAMAERVYPGAWEGYRATEPLLGRLTKDPQIGDANTLIAEYRREQRPDAYLRLAWLTVIHVEEASRSKETVIGEQVIERRRYPIKLPAGVKETEEVEHTFEETTTFTDAYTNAIKRAWEAGGKASISASYGGIGGAVEAFAKYGETAESGRAHNEGKTRLERDRVSRKFEVTGPVDFEVEAYRARQTVQRIITARADFDGKMYFFTGASIESGQARVWEFTTYQSQFLPIARRIADDSIYGYQEFMDKPLSDAELDAIEAPLDALVQFPVVYDNVTVQSLKEV